MATKFFTNQDGNTLFKKLSGVAHDLGPLFHTFQAVSGYFRSSGYFKLRAELKDVKKIQILVGINVDDIFRKQQQQGMLALADPKQAKRIFADDFINDVKDAKYAQDVEEGILQLVQDVTDGIVEMRIHPSKNLHAKFYLCLPETYTANTSGCVIMGSSNLTDAGLGTVRADRYELNVELKDYDDVKFCIDEFDRLWNEGVAISPEDIAKAKAKTHLDRELTPFELFMKVLIEAFGEMAEDAYSTALPDGFKDLKYQRDAVVQGFQMMMKYNGFFLADVVGLGKTIVAAMIARRFTEANGRTTQILVVHPPAVERNWKDTFKLFGIRNAQFVSNGSISKILNGEDNYRAKEEYDLVIVDESHNFRNAGIARYDELQRITKAPRINRGLTGDDRKKVILVSATALNNDPSDLRDQILLFQDARRSNLPGISGVQEYFAGPIKEYKTLQKKRKDGETVDVARIDAIFSRIQEDVLRKITVRRTRKNIENDPDYAHDLDRQHIRFPKLSDPKTLKYPLAGDLEELFILTRDLIQGKIEYARYRAIEFLKPEFRSKYKQAKHIADTLAGIYRVHMIKRLESSFFALKKSLKTFEKITDDMIRMFAEDKVLIIPEIDVKGLMDKGWELDKIIDLAVEKLGCETKDVSYPADSFDPKFVEMLKADLEIIRDLRTRWDSVTEDPKLDLFIEQLKGPLFNSILNKSGKLVVFSESVDTLDYLNAELKKRLDKSDILEISSGNRDSEKKVIRANFDANIPSEEMKDDFNIILTSDVLAEGVNLHRSNVIVNYDSPWNATRLMQRIGRVNRIGSQADEIHSFMFYPSDQGNREIALYQNSVLKLQAFHSTFGEDSKIYSVEEIVKDFKLYDADVKDETDEQLRYLRIVRKFYNEHKQDYHRLKSLPPKSRVVRSGASGETVVFMSSSFESASYRVKDGVAEEIHQLEAFKLMEAKPDEKSVRFPGNSAERHFADVNTALDKFNASVCAVEEDDGFSLVTTSTKNKHYLVAHKFLNGKALKWAQEGVLGPESEHQIAVLSKLVRDGVYYHLEDDLVKLADDFKGLAYNAAPSAEDRARVVQCLDSLCRTYCATSVTPQPVGPSDQSVTILAAETFEG